MNTVWGDIMTKTNRIRASFILGAAILTGAGCLWNASLETAPEKKQEKSKSKQEEMKETASSETPYEYVIVNDNGYLTVYQKDLKTFPDRYSVCGITHRIAEKDRSGLPDTGCRRTV